MTPEEWQRVRPILESALELDAASRPAFLDGACEDLFLRREVESLINSHERAGTNVLEPGSALKLKLDEEAQFRLLPGRRIGVYEIAEEIAVGGMGAVYRAIRADGQYKQQVALKIVRSELGAESTAARFRNERQILANLDHPNIAKILDAGTTADGLPYFVMEFIDGLPITEHCDQSKLTIDERLKIFRTVCSAVHYAHQRLVIHRDIKPGNILITSDGVPKLLDFGIAKILDPSLLAENAGATLAGLWVMTPEYASPEQLRGEAITTATDVYSLGLVLYELLAGRRTYRRANHLPHEIARAVLETDPEKPSTAIRRKDEIAEQGKEKVPLTPELISGLRADSPEKLHRRIAGDLDNIVMKTIRKDPRERYNSADQLSEDIRRHLEHLPVLARNSTVVYRCRQYVLRHKVGVTAAALVFLSLLAGIALTLREARIARANELRAERRFNDVRQLANSLMFEVHDSIKDLAGATPARKLLVEKALQYLDSLSQEAGGDISLQRELAAAYEKVGHVQGNPYAANLGDAAGALASYRKALAIREFLPTSNSEENQQNLANDYGWIGTALSNLGDYRGALENYRKDFSIQYVLTKTAPSVKSQERLAGVYFLVARGYSDLQDPKSALENYRRSAAIRETIATGSPFVQSHLAGTYSYMGGILHNLGDPTQAVMLQRKSLEILKKLSDADPTNATNREFLDEAYYWTGFYLEKNGDFALALVNYRYALADLQTLASADPKEVRTREYVARCHKSIGTTLVAEDNITQGLQSIRKALSIFQELPPVETTTQFVADTYDAIGLAYSRQAAKPGLSSPARIANWKQARAAYQKSLDKWMESENRGGLTAFDVGEPDRIRSELAKCEAALTSLALELPSSENQKSK
jgi:serine/threonine protein kinase/tetratricopeptide (TPR) repeat protein